MKRPENLIIVIFGASGDLTKRKLIPALFDLQLQNILPHGFAVLGVGRTKLSNEDFRDQMMKSLVEYCFHPLKNKNRIHAFSKNLYYEPINTSNAHDYNRLSKRIDDIDEIIHHHGNCIFYLATPPSLFDVITKNLHQNQLNISKTKNSVRRIVLEKPFGKDLESARQLNNKLLRYFKEEQIYRIDHYLGKETVQNLLVTRFSNGIFEPLWNRNYINHIEITSVEDIGLESRGGYYDQSGALRDMVQNHLLQLTGLIAMEPPAVINSESIRNEILKVFQSFQIISKHKIPAQVIRGQYIASNVKGKPVKGYREEDGVNPQSRTETYVALKFYIDNWRWGGVPFYIRTGKRLPTRVTEIVIHFKKIPHPLFGFKHQNHENENQLVIRIQPDEGILLKIGMKMPGAGFDVYSVNMDFHYKDLSEIYLPSAYERLLLDCMLGDSTLYSRGDTVMAAWKFIDPILKEWEKNPDLPMIGYPAGTWGPPEADALIEGEKSAWRYPCKNLTNDGNYCEL